MTGQGFAVFIRKKMDQPDKEFVYQRTDWQYRLFGYLVTLLASLHDARDVLQETNLVLWRKMSDFATGIKGTSPRIEQSPFPPPSNLRQGYDRQAGPATSSSNGLHP